MPPPFNGVGMIYVIDDLMPEDEAIRFSEKFFSDPMWHAKWNKGLSDTEKRAWNWHRSPGTDIRDMGLGRIELAGEAEELWSYVSPKITGYFNEVPHLPTRYYSNSHTYAVDGPIHRDDGDVTAIYYPCQDWKLDWEGGTAFYNESLDDCIKYATYKFNRLVIFKASILHRAMPVTRECYELRTSIVFKTQMDTNSPEYANWYNTRS